MGNHEFYKYYDVATLPDGYLLEVRPNVFSHYNGIARIGDTDIILSTLGRGFLWRTLTSPSK